MYRAWAWGPEHRSFVGINPHCVLAEMNTLMMQMRHTAHELRVTLDHVLQGGEASMAPQSSENKAMSFLSEPEPEMSAIHNIPEVRTWHSYHGRTSRPAVAFWGSFLPSLSGRPQLFLSVGESSGAQEPIRTHGRGHGLQEVHLGSADDPVRQRNFSHTLGAGTEEHRKRGRFPETAASAWDLAKHHRWESFTICFVRACLRLNHIKSLLRFLFQITCRPSLASITAKLRRPSAQSWTMKTNC